MSQTLQQRVDQLRVKAQMLTERHRALLQEHQDALSRIEQLTQQADALRRQVAELELEVQHMQVATALAPDHRDAQAAWEFLSRLTREIDKCIAQLTL